MRTKVVSARVSVTLFSDASGNCKVFNKILLVENDRLALRVITAILGREYDVETVGSGRRAIDAISQREPYAAIIANVVMPDMCGETFFEASAKLAPSTLRILLTGYGIEGQSQLAWCNSSVTRIVSKPYALQTLRPILKDMLSKYTRCEQPAASGGSLEEHRRHTAAYVCG